MTDIPHLVSERLAPAFAAVARDSNIDPVVRRSDHADYQANGALPLAKRLRRNPREVAAEILEQADLTGLVAKAEIAGPGFLNLTIDNTALAGLVSELSTDDRLGVRLEKDPPTVVVDYSGPNVAREMRVPHLRSTIIGDAQVRMLEFFGHEVIRQNHLGDWGTQFGKLIEHLIDSGLGEAGDELDYGDLNEFYREANRRFDDDPGFADRSRHRVVLLQSGDVETMRLWRVLIDKSKMHFDSVYRMLGVKLQPEDYMGESAYNSQLGDVVNELQEKGMGVESDGAIVTFPQGFTGREGAPVPLILRKRDGGFGYDVTDLAAIRNRARDLGGEELVYVTDLGQRMHFEMVFETAREAGWLNGVTARFAGFGVVLGPDRRRLRTRAGDNPKLVDLLAEGERRAATVVAEKAPDLPAEERAKVARAVGIGAIKYADLSSYRVKDYVFDYEQMLSFEGNTAPYLQYAHARIHSVFRKCGIDPASVRRCRIEIIEPSEHALAVRLGEFVPAVRGAVAEVEAHRVAAYLYDLATAFTAFYESCPVLRAADEDTRRSRLALAALTARTLATGLGLLGIEAPKRM